MFHGKIKHMRFSYISFTVILSIIFLNCSPAQADTSLIDVLMMSRESVVSVRANTIAKDLPLKGDRIIDSSTGKIVAARNLKAATYEKIGAGVIVDSKGLIVTNYHTVFQSSFIDIYLFDGTKRHATIKLLLPQHDLALLSIAPPFQLTPIEIADSSSIELGNEIVNIGNSPLLHDTLSGGYITGIGTNATTGEIDLLKISINLYRGDSGGPILDRKGHLCGMIMGEINRPPKTTIAIPANKIQFLYREYLN